MSDLISIIVPVYNVALHLAKCLDSILLQSYQNFELLLIDDGSTDESGKICDEYAQKDLRIRVVHVKNGGASAARNYGMEICQGEYFAFVDSDDWVEPDYIKSMYDAIKKYGADFAQSGANYWYPDGHKEILQLQSSVELVLSKREMMQKWFVKSWEDGIYGLVWGKLYHRKLIPEMTFVLERVPHEDLIAICDLVTSPKAQCAVLINNICYNYIIWNGGQSKAQTSHKAVSEYYAWLYILKAVPADMPEAFEWLREHTFPLFTQLLYDRRNDIPALRQICHEEPEIYEILYEYAQKIPMSFGKSHINSQADVRLWWSLKINVRFGLWLMSLPKPILRGIDWLFRLFYY